VKVPSTQLIKERHAIGGPSVSVHIPQLRKTIARKPAIDARDHEKKDGLSYTGEEVYTMRYWFPDELEAAITSFGFH